MLKCHETSMAAGTPFQLRVFVSGRNRLENEGATALAQAFKVVFLLLPLIKTLNYCLCLM